MTTLKELEASAAEVEETLHTTTVHQSKLYGRAAKRKQLLNKDHSISIRVHPKACERIQGQLSEGPEAMFCGHETLHITTNTPSPP